MCFIISSISYTITCIIAYKLLLKASLLPKIVKIISISQIAKALML